jgi:hypothetical protein
MEYNFNIVGKLRRITQTYDYFNGTVKQTNHLYFNYDNVHEKSAKRINNIISQINKKKCGIKKYQVRGYYEYKIIHKYCITNNIKHELIIDENVVTNKVTNIKQYVTDYDHENNLQQLIVEHEKVPVMYIKIYPTISQCSTELDID